MIELVLTVCAMTAASSCEDKRLPFDSEESLLQCAFQAPPYIAAWAQDHPYLRVMRWRCAVPGADGARI